MITRRSLLLSGAATAVLAGSASLAFAAPSEGVLTIAMIGEPPTLDIMQTTTDLVITIDQHIFETLYTYDAEWNTAPLLAANAPQISEDGLTYTIPLRSGVTFHDGSAMTPEDVVASLQRWMAVSTKGKQVAELVASLTAKDNAVEIVLTKRFAPLIPTLTYGAVVMPKATLAETLTDFIGTGPYALKERKPDQYIQLVRFDGYASPEGASSNYAGNREAIAREIHFVPVPDANTRLEGLLSGQFDFADALPTSAYGRIEDNDRAAPVIYKNAAWMSMNFNHKDGLLTNKTLRHAVQLALNPADMMMAAFDEEKFYGVDGSIYPEGFVWHTEAGVARYGEGDSEGAMKLLTEAGYDGTPLRILTSRQYEFHYKAAEVAKAYLEAAGFKVDLQVVDWATLTSRRGDAALWDIFITHSNFPGDPTMLNLVSDAYPGWYVSEQKTAAVNAYLEATTQDDKLKAWEAVQTAVYEDVPLYKVGSFNALSGLSKQVSGYTPAYWPFFWNVTPKE
ncbi:ABC transporter substrate-binding protein [Phaeovulum sp. W22_SRMD_FR3]|uniref:ABC transporter substrate-binding protein n=1 Tax=Phaeovulum sp. W22_SRMD_FR3 TaxID=3240274 RepID=UPI003F962AE2